MHKRHAEPRSNRWLEWLVVVIGILLAVRSGVVVLRLWKAGDRLEVARTQLYEAQQENLRLKGQLAEAKSDEYVEREARNMLGYGREGEVIILLPKNEGVAGKEGVLKEVESVNEPNWRKWWNLYVGI